MAVVPNKSVQSQGKWVSEQVYSDTYSIPRQTLCNWRYRDRKAGRRQAEDGYPQYRYFGKAVRYFVPIHEQFGLRGNGEPLSAA